MSDLHFLALYTLVFGMKPLNITITCDILFYYHLDTFVQFDGCDGHGYHQPQSLRCFEGDFLPFLHSFYKIRFLLFRIR